MEEATGSSVNGNASSFKKEEPEDSDADPVIHEIPLFLSKSLANNLYLLQYPVRPHTMPYPDSSVIAGRVRPTQHQIELDMALDLTSRNFDRSKAEQMALNVSKMPESESEYPSGKLDKVKMVSTKALQKTDRYAIGILDANELHMTPLNTILTMRTSLDYLDWSEKQAAAANKKSEDSDDEATEASDATIDLKPVTVKFAKTNSDQERMKKAQEKSFEFQQQKAKQEKWQPLNLIRPGSEAWQAETSKLFCQHMDEEAMSSRSTPQEYLQILHH